MIRIHKDPTTPEAIADTLRLNLGDVMEREANLPNDVPLIVLLAKNPSFKDWVLQIMKTTLFTNQSSMKDESFSQFSQEDIEAFEVSQDFIDSVLEIVKDERKEEFVKYRKELIEESIKENPQFVEV